MAHPAHETAATVTPYVDGPLLLRGDFELRTPDGAVIDSGRGTVALCRCGASARKPFCDGSHRAVRFRAAAEPDHAPDGSSRLYARPDTHAESGREPDSSGA